jgi:hypothetical protein
MIIIKALDLRFYVLIAILMYVELVARLIFYPSQYQNVWTLIVLRSGVENF